MQLSDLRQLLTIAPLRDRAHRVDPSQSGLSRLLLNKPRDAGVVIHRDGVRHAGHRGEATGDRGRHAGRYRLFVLVPRLTQVRVHVNETRTHDAVSRYVDDRRTRLDWQITPHRLDPTVDDQQVGRPIHAVD